MNEDEKQKTRIQHIQKWWLKERERRVTEAIDERAEWISGSEFEQGRALARPCVLVYIYIYIYIFGVSQQPGKQPCTQNSPGGLESPGKAI